MIPSRMRLAAVVAILLAASTAQAQINFSRVYSRPALPSSEVLRRLNLTMAWRAYIPMDGTRDRITRVEMYREDMYVVTRSGQVVRLNAETGEQRWRARVGKPYTIAPFVAVNSRSVYLIANAEGFSLDRATGARKWSLPMRTGISAGPVVDEEQIYLPGSNSRLYAYLLPFVSADEAERRGLAGSKIYAGITGDDDRRPKPVWEEETNIQLAFQPLQTDDVIFVIGPDGKASGYSKVLREGQGSTEVYRFSTEDRIRAPQGQYGDIGYIGSDDATLYAINLYNGKLRWRHSTGTAVTRRPIALETDVFVTSDRRGLARVDRESGDSMWKLPRGGRLLDTNPDADRFLAANNRFVYAADRSGRLVILDRKRGTRLSMFDTSAYRVPIVNSLTDRLYLAANDGLIVCLHDRDQIRPIRHQRLLEQASSPIPKRLEQKISDPGSPKITLRDMLARLRVNFKLHFVIGEAAFKEAGNPNVQDKEITVPRSDNRQLKDLVKIILDQVDAIYQIEGETLLVLPKPPKAKAPGK